MKTAKSKSGVEGIYLKKIPFKKNKAFTLIEVLIVVGLAIGAATSMYTLFAGVGSTMKSEDEVKYLTHTINDIDNVTAAINVYQGINLDTLNSLGIKGSSVIGVSSITTPTTKSISFNYQSVGQKNCIDIVKKMTSLEDITAKVNGLDVPNNATVDNVASVCNETMASNEFSIIKTKQSLALASATPTTVMTSFPGAATPSSAPITTSAIPASAPTGTAIPTSVSPSVPSSAATPTSVATSTTPITTVSSATSPVAPSSATGSPTASTAIASSSVPLTPHTFQVNVLYMWMNNLKSSSTLQTDDPQWLWNQYVATGDVNTYLMRSTPYTDYWIDTQAGKSYSHDQVYTDPSTGKTYLKP